MKTLWLALAGCCIAVSATLMVLGRFDAAFVVAVIGMVAWFLNYRAQVTASLEADDATTDEENETERNEDQ